MPHLLQGLFGERSITKLAVICQDRAQADAAARLAQSAGLAPAQVRVLTPAMAAQSHREWFAAAAEPEPGGIWRTFWRAHTVMGALGAVAGAALYAGFLAAGNPAVAGSPRLALLAMVFFGGVLGLLLGGLITLRPDHSTLLTRLRQALSQGQCAVIVHPTDPSQVQRTSEALGAHGHDVLRTL